MRMVALGDVATIERRAVDRATLPADTAYLGLEHIERGGAIIGHGTVGGAELASTKFRLTAEHVLFGKLRPYLGKVSRPTLAGVCSTDILPIKPLPALNRDYLAHYLAQPAMVAFAGVRATGANLPRLSPAELARFPVPLPPLDQQRRIAAVLDAADAIRAKRRQVLAHLDSLTQSIFHAMFGAAGSHLYVGETVKLADLMSLKSGKFLPASAQDGGPYAVYGGNGVTGFHSNYLFEDTKIVIGRVGAYRGAVHLTRPQAWITDNALYAADVSPKVSLRYLRDALASANLNQYASQSGQPLVSASRLSEVTIIVPTKSAQAQYVERVIAMEALHERIEHALADDDALFASLQSRAFRGEL